MSECNYGCGREAKFTLSNGKKCCAKSHNHCPKLKLTSKERMIEMNNTIIDSPATKKGYKQPETSCPVCKKHISKNNLHRHLKICGKPKGNCKNCGKELYNYNKTCSKECARELASKNRNRSLLLNGLDSKKNTFPYITLNKDILFLDSSFELSACVLLDIYKAQRIICDWNYNRTESFHYEDHSGKDKLYFPDFKIYAIKNEIYWLEVKGYKTPTDTLKWDTLKKSGERLMVWLEDDIKKYQDDIKECVDNKDWRTIWGSTSW